MLCWYQFCWFCVLLRARKSRARMCTKHNRASASVPRARQGNLPGPAELSDPSSIVSASAPVMLARVCAAFCSRNPLMPGSRLRCMPRASTRSACAQRFPMIPEPLSASFDPIQNAQYAPLAFFSLLQIADTLDARRFSCFSLIWSNGSF